MSQVIEVPEPDVVAVHLLSAPVRLACPVLPGGAATRSARYAGPAPRRPAAARPPARLPAGANGRKPPGTPAARRSPHRSSAAGHPRCPALRPGWRGGPSVDPRRRTLRSARPVKPGPRPARDGGRPPGAAGPGRGRGGKAARAVRRGHACLNAARCAVREVGQGRIGPRVPPHYPLTREIRFSGPHSEP
jgi:hypothetical protein